MAEYDNVDGRCSGELGRLFAAALIGGVIGAAVGLLLAPKAGAELRIDLKDKAGVAAQKAHGIQAKAKDMVQAAKQKIEERRATVDEVDEIIDDAEAGLPEVDN